MGLIFGGLLHTDILKVNLNSYICKLPNISSSSTNKNLIPLTTLEPRVEIYLVPLQVGDKGKMKKKLFGVRAILGVRSRVFQEMLYGISTVFGSPQVDQAREAPGPGQKEGLELDIGVKSVLSNYFCTTQILCSTFWEIWCIQIQIYPQTSIEPKYGAFYL